MITRIDLGCGPKKKEGCFGIDSTPNPGVDCVLNITKDRLPFEDGTIDYIFTPHCLEHLNSSSHTFKEISRVAKDGATLDIWLPYLWVSMPFFPATSLIGVKGIMSISACGTQMFGERS